MSNHRARTWDHRGSKPLGPNLLPLGHHLDGSSPGFIFMCWSTSKYTVSCFIAISSWSQQPIVTVVRSFVLLIQYMDSIVSLGWIRAKSTIVYETKQSQASSFCSEIDTVMMEDFTDVLWNPITVLTGHGAWSSLSAQLFRNIYLLKSSLFLKNIILKK